MNRFINHHQEEESVYQSKRRGGRWGWLEERPEPYIGDGFVKGSIAVESGSGFGHWAQHCNGLEPSIEFGCKNGLGNRLGNGT